MVGVAWWHGYLYVLLSRELCVARSAILILFYYANGYWLEDNVYISILSKVGISNDSLKIEHTMVKKKNPKEPRKRQQQNCIVKKFVMIMK